MTPSRRLQTRTTRRGRGPLVRLAGGTSLLAASGWCLVVLGRTLPAPPGGPGEVVGWIDRHGAAVGVLTVLRAGALVAVAYLLVVGVLVAAAQLGGVPRLRILLHHLPGRVGPRVVECGLGVGAAAGLAGALLPTTAMAGTATPGTVAPPDESALMVPLDGEHRSDPVTPGRSVDPEPTPRPADRPEHDPPDQDESVEATMHSLDPDPATPEAPPAEPTAAAPQVPTGEIAEDADASDRPPAQGSPPDDGVDEAALPPTTDDTWLVARGDHLWGIAAETVGEQVHNPGDREVFDYWQRLVATNHDRLVDPDNPDLLFPGQVLRLPALVEPG